LRVRLQRSWGISSAGRAPALHAGGQRFDPVILHHFKSIDNFQWFIRTLKTAYNHIEIEIKLETSFPIKVA
jgi:hypothetical protein